MAMDRQNGKLKATESHELMDGAGEDAAERVAKKVIDYINNNQLSSTTASLGGVSEESGLVKVKIKIGANSFDSYATKDGKFLFPQAFDMSVKKQPHRQIRPQATLIPLSPQHRPQLPYKRQTNQC